MSNAKSTARERAFEKWCTRHVISDAEVARQAFYSGWAAAEKRIQIIEPPTEPVQLAITQH